MNIMNVTLFVCVTSATWRKNCGKVVGAWGQRSPVTMIILNGLMKCFYGVRFSLIILPLLSFFVLLIQTSFCLGESVQPWRTKGGLTSLLFPLFVWGTSLYKPWLQVTHGTDSQTQTVCGPQVMICSAGPCACTFGLICAAETLVKCERWNK